MFEYVDKKKFDFANNKHRIFTLTAPTGLGKTFTSINFALNLRKQIEFETGNKPRIIYVAPFLSILDQNMEALRKVFLGNTKNNNSNSKIINTSLLLMHHHLSPINAEVIITTFRARAIPQRVSFVIKNEHRITLNEFCNEMNDLISKHQDENILIELNTIFTAKECFDNLHSYNHDMRFLSSQVIPKHRRPRRKDIKKKLNDDDSKKKVILVTTQVIEAGVDLDFDIAVRDIGPIDSIVQTAGRCNREGRNKTEDLL